MSNNEASAAGASGAMGASSPLSEASASSLDVLFARFDAHTSARTHGSADANEVLKEIVEVLRSKRLQWASDEASGKKSAIRAKRGASAKQEFDPSALGDL